MNIQSINNKKNQLELELDQYKPLFVSLVETWCKPGDSGDVGLQGYRAVAMSSRKHSRGGGTLLLAREDLDAASVDMGGYVREKDFEVCVARYHSTAGNITLITVYRAPQGDIKVFFEMLERCLDEVFLLRTKFG